MNLPEAELERRIADLRARLPQHSLPAAMLLELEELEEELETRRKLATESRRLKTENCEL